jgi:hypothetical protein
MTQRTRNQKLLYCTMCLIACALFCLLRGDVIAQRQTGNSDKAWQEIASTEGKFRVLMPEAPNEMSLPTSSSSAGGGQLFYVKSSVAIYGVIYGSLPNAMDDDDFVKTALESTSAFLQASGKLRVVSEKNISSPGVQARQFIVDDGAFITTDRVYYTKGRLYEVIFSRPGLSGTSSEALLQYYDGLSGKFFNSFKIGG